MTEHARMKVSANSNMVLNFHVHVGRLRKITVSGKEEKNF